MAKTEAAACSSARARWWSRRASTWSPTNLNRSLPGAEPDLGVQDLVALVPDLVQPPQAMAGLGGQGMVLAVQAALDEQQLGHRVGGRVTVGQVAGPAVEPPRDL